jgi:hypothetical protein
MPVAPCIALGGTARRYYNPATNVTIARERYEREYGSLAKRGAKSFKEAAKRTPPETRSLRPSKSPTYSRKPVAGSKRFSGLEPLTGRKSRAVNIPFHAFWDGDIHSFIDDAEPYRAGYNDAIRRIQANSKIASLYVLYDFINHITGVSGIRPVNTAHDKASADTYDEITAQIIEHLQSRTNIEIVSLQIRVVFFERYVKQPAKKRGLRLTPKRKRK